MPRATAITISVDPLRNWRNALLVLVAVATLVSVMVTVDALVRAGLLLGTARVGQYVQVSGGQMRVDAVLPETLAPMNHQKFANLGMTMAAMVPDSTPEGMRTFAVLVTVIGEHPGFEFELDHFTVSGKGMQQVTALRSDIGAALVPAGSVMQGTVVFRVPIEATNLTLQYAGSSHIQVDYAHENRLTVDH
jgi:hypothetical protein